MNRTYYRVVWDGAVRVNETDFTSEEAARGWIREVFDTKAGVMSRVHNVTLKRITVEDLGFFSRDDVDLVV